MENLLKQLILVLRISFSTMNSRFASVISIVVTVGVVVGVLLMFLSMSEGFKKTLLQTGSDKVAVVSRMGSKSELNSNLTLEQINVIAGAPGIRTRDRGKKVISEEVYVIVNGVKKEGGNVVNLPLRGLGWDGISLREKFALVKGRLFTPGKNELIAGVSVASQYRGFDLGSVVKLGRSEWKVVGIFDDGGSVFGSELWADCKTVQGQFNRVGSVQVVRLGLDGPDSLKTAKEYFKADSRLDVDATLEREFFAEQSTATSDFLFALGWPLSIVMAVGALAAAINTMYSAVAARTAEVATMRAIGFDGKATFLATIVESVALASLGGVVGSVVAYLVFHGVTASTLGGRNFTQIVFDFTMDYKTILQGLMMALSIGVLGGIGPAWKSASVAVREAFVRVD